VQSVRGHIAIEALEEFLPRKARRFRALVSDIVCLAFCGFFDWQCWLLLLEAIDDGRVTDSAWAPPLWIPYSLMTAGMTFLCLRFFLQIVDAVLSKRKTPA
jgi:TRAP-type C4-dicarboxylate transport system permease small subunit